MTDFMESPLSQIPPADPILPADTPDPEAESQAGELEAWYEDFKRERAAEAVPPADPTPSAAVAPTGGERMIPEHEVYGETGIVMLYHLALTEAAQNLIALGFKGGCDNEILSEALEAVEAHEPRAALSSPVRAEPTDLPLRDAELLSRAASWLVADDGGSPYTHDLIAMLAHRVEALLESSVRAERGEAERDAERLDWFDANAAKDSDGRLAFPGHTGQYDGNDEPHPVRAAIDRELDDAALTPTPPATPTEPTDG